MPVWKACCIVLIALLVGCTPAPAPGPEPDPDPCPPAPPIPEPGPTPPQPQPDPEPEPEPDPEPDPDDKLSPSAQGLYDGGERFRGANVQKSEPHPDVMAAAKEYCEYEAKRDRQLGHANFSRRMRELGEKVPGMYWAEITAQSWNWQTEEPMDVIGYGMFESWRQSSGHWRVARAKHTVWGGHMAMSSSGTWYACIITGDANKTAHSAEPDDESYEPTTTAQKPKFSPAFYPEED